MPPTPEDIQAVLYPQMISTIGLLFGILLTGMLIVLGVSSILLLSSIGGDRSLSRRNRFLCVYIFILLLAVLALDAGAFILGNAFTILFSQPPNKLQEFRGMWGKIVGSTTVVIGFLTDGIFVWRCFMVQQALGPYNSSKWGNMFWAFPACLWMLALITGGISNSLNDVRNPVFPGIPGIVAIASNSALNIYATLFITIRLLAHRKLIIACLGNETQTMQHLRIVTILLESAAVNVPIALATAVGFGTGKTFGVVTGLIAPPSQALASVVIIHQVALGRAFDQQKEDGLKTEVTSESSLDS